MIFPDLETFQEQCRQPGTVPVMLEIPADLDTPVSAYLKLRDSGAFFLLESVESGEQLGRYSFIGLHPQGEIKLEGNCLSAHLFRNSSEMTLEPFELFPALEKLLSERAVQQLPGLPLLLGGAVGYLSYDTVRHVEKLPSTATPFTEFPDVWLRFPGMLLVFDHVKRKIKLLILVEPSGDLKECYDGAVKRLWDLASQLGKPLPESSLFHMRIAGAGAETTALPTSKDLTFTREGYIEAVEKAKEHIRAGDIFQIVLSQRRTGETHAAPFQIYRSLRMVNPSPYLFFLDFGEFQVIGSSPETLVKLEGDAATVKPIAGTRRRGACEEEDLALEKELLADEKERAEHIMLVDLGRNDLGRVCSYGSVKVPQFMKVERYSHVMHLVSTVEGHLKPSATMFDLFRATFPAGTVSGAPKVRAMELIEELEGVRRGPYAGCAGYFGFGGNMDMCIAIRTILMKGNRYFVQAGAGIVADSVPEKEWEETCSKLGALTQAITQAEEGLA